MPFITLTPDETDDLIYDVRTGDTAQIDETLQALTTKYTTTPAVIIASAVDSSPEEEGGSGCNVLHYAAANGYTQILTTFLTTLTSAQSQSASTSTSTSTPENQNVLTAEEVKKTVNHGNYSGNTPLHWAALNSHLECVKALVGHGADMGIKNAAGHDSVFLAERADWSEQAKAKGRDEARDEDEDQEIEITVGGSAEGDAEQAQDAGPKTKGREVVEWLLQFGDPAAAAAAPGGDEAL